MTTSERPSATIYRMVMPEHVCPFGLKARDILRRRGYAVDDHWLTTRAETDAFKVEHNVQTTPQTFIDRKRIGGYDDLRRFFGMHVADPGATSYQPVLWVFGVAALMALAANWATSGSLVDLRSLGWFIAFSMCILALLKLQDVESFSSMFLGYDLLAQRWVPYSYIYPYAELLAGVLMVAGALIWVSIPVAGFNRDDRCCLGYQGCLYRSPRHQMRLRRRQQQGAARLRLPDGEPDDGHHGSMDGHRQALASPYRFLHYAAGADQSYRCRGWRSLKSLRIAVAATAACPIA